MSAAPTVGGRFLLLCLPERQPLYDATLREFPYQFTLVNDVRELLAKCVQDPPWAVLVDAATAARIGAAVLNPLYGLPMGWPILRCLPQPDGGVSVMCARPPRHGTLAEAVAAIAAGDPAWLPESKRRDMRVDVHCRVRTRLAGTDEWRRGNCLDVSRGGAFVLSYETIALGTQVELELWDLVANPVVVAARIVRLRKWEEGTDLPGFAVAFEPASVPREVHEALVTLLYVTGLVH